MQYQQQWSSEGAEPRGDGRDPRRTTEGSRARRFDTPNYAYSPTSVFGGGIPSAVVDDTSGPNSLIVARLMSRLCSNTAYGVARCSVQRLSHTSRSPTRHWCT